MEKQEGEGMRRKEEDGGEGKRRQERGGRKEEVGRRR